jgi:mannobiose 2-epimerase
MSRRGILFVATAIASFAARPSNPMPAPSSAAPAPTATELRGYAAGATQELRQDILPFWLQHARDAKRGGFVGRIGQDMTVYPDAPRGTLLTSRILWTFSAAYRRFRDPQYVDMAQWAYRDLVDRGFDPQQGGLFWSVAPDGKPVDARKHIYGQAFGVYGLSEYYRATHDQAALDRAIALYRLIEEKARDHQHGGYFESFTRDWKRDEVGQRQIMGNRGPKSQNTHIHILEAYTNLLRVWPDPGLRESVHALTDLMLTRIIDPKTHHLILFFHDDWTPISDEVSYGHDIELSWLVVEAATALGDDSLIARAKQVAVEMANATLAQGIDRDGGVFNEANPKGLTDPNKDWWPQAEATVGFLNAYQISGDPRFYRASRHTWEFIQATCIDRKNGDWYESVTRSGEPRVRSKLSVWKCPYHNSRACLEIIERTEEFAAKRGPLLPAKRDVRESGERMHTDKQ